MNYSKKNFGILSLASDLPTKRISLEDISKQFRVDENILTKKLGFLTKSVAIGSEEHPSDFAFRSAKKAILKSDIKTEKIGLVIFTGISRDYLPSWSVSLDIAGRLKIPNAITFDLTMGCAGTLLALELAKKFNLPDDRPYVLVCAAERWSQTISENVPFSLGLLAHADGGSACILGPESSNYFGKMANLSYPEMNSYFYIPAGGTKEPASESTIKSNRHYRQKTPAEQEVSISDIYVKSYRQVIDDCLKLNNCQFSNFHYLTTNQVRKEIRSQIANHYNIAPENYPSTYENIGHVGTADLFISLERIWPRIATGQSVMCASSSPSTYCALPLFFKAK